MKVALVTLAVLALVAFRQFTVVDEAVAERALIQAQLEKAEQNQKIYERALLRAMGERLLKDSSAAGVIDDGILMIVDGVCRACDRALKTLADQGLLVSLQVASFHDTADELREWLRLYDLDLPVFPGRIGLSLEYALPIDVAPLFVVMDDGTPVRIHIGQPIPEWLEPGNQG